MTKENDSSQKHKMYFSGSEESHLTGVNPSSRKALGDEDKYMVSKPMSLWMPKKDTVGGSQIAYKAS